MVRRPPIRLRGLIVLAAMLLSAVPAGAQLVIGHRGAAGERPEHTLAGYERAIEEGADYIEPDLVPTRDGVLVARHENEIGGTTDVTAHPEFAARQTTRLIDGKPVSGWFVEDFTLAELRTLRARERLPDMRPANARFDGRWMVPTFAEILALARSEEARTGRRIGLYPELKHPAYFAAREIDTPALLLAALKRAGRDGADSMVFIQCFEAGTLERLRLMTRTPLVQLIAKDAGPPDRPGLAPAQMLTPAGLRAIARYADAIGAEASLLIGPGGRATPVIADAHAAGLQVHAWTLRRENRFLPKALQAGSDPNSPGRFAIAWWMLDWAGVDGIFTDNPGSVPWRTSWTELLGSLLGLVNIVLLVRRSVWNFPVAMVMVSLIGVTLFEARLYSEAGLQVFFFVVNAIGWYVWSRAKSEETHEVPVGWMTWPVRGAWAVVTTALSLSLGWIMHRFTNAALPFGDSAVAGASIAAQLLLTIRRVENWVLWVAIDVVSVGLYLYRGLFFLAALYVAFGVISVLGLREWKKAAAGARS